MKKTLGLVMALVMILTAVSAFAAVPSKTTADLVTVTTDNKNASVKVTSNASAPVTELLEKLMADNSIPAEVKAALPEDSTATKVEEAVTMIISGGSAEQDLIVNLKFPTNYAGKNVSVSLGVLDGGKIAEWKSAAATAKEDGSIDVVLTGALQDWLNGREFIALIAD